MSKFVTISPSDADVGDLQMKLRETLTFENSLGARHCCTNSDTQSDIHII